MYSKAKYRRVLEARTARMKAEGYHPLLVDLEQSLNASMLDATYWPSDMLHRYVAAEFHDPENLVVDFHILGSGVVPFFRAILDIPPEDLEDAERFTLHEFVNLGLMDILTHRQENCVRAFLATHMENAAGRGVLLRMAPSLTGLCLRSRKVYVEKEGDDDLARIHFVISGGDDSDADYTLTLVFKKEIIFRGPTVGLPQCKNPKIVKQAATVHYPNGEVELFVAADLFSSETARQMERKTVELGYPPETYKTLIQVQGYLDTNMTHLTPLEAWSVAERHGQILRRYDGDGPEGDGLHPENMSKDAP